MCGESRRLCSLLAAKTLIAKRMPRMPRKPSVPKESRANFGARPRCIPSYAHACCLAALRLRRGAKRISHPGLPRSVCPSPVQSSPVQGRAGQSQAGQGRGRASRAAGAVRRRRGAVERYTVRCERRAAGAPSGRVCCSRVVCKRASGHEHCSLVQYCSCVQWFVWSHMVISSIFNPIFAIPTPHPNRLRAFKRVGLGGVSAAPSCRRRAISHPCAASSWPGPC